MDGSKMDRDKYIKSLIEYHNSPDEWTDGKELRNKLYKEYSTTLTTLVAKYEVHCRDLPRDIVAIIEMSFRLIAATSNATLSTEQIETNTELACKLQRHAINCLYLKLTCQYINEIKNHIKIIKCFTFKGNKQSFNGKNITYINYLKNNIKQINKVKKLGKKELNKRFQKNFFNTFDEMLFDFKMIQDDGIIDDLKTSFEKSEELLSSIENTKNYSDILKSGYVGTIKNWFMNDIFGKLSTVLTVIAIIIKIIG